MSTVQYRSCTVQYRTVVRVKILVQYEYCTDFIHKYGTRTGTVHDSDMNRMKSGAPDEMAPGQATVVP